MRLPTRLRAQALALFLGVACVYAAFSPFTVRAMGYGNETMRACGQLLTPERPRVPPDFGVDWPRNGSTEVFLLCPFQALGRAFDPASIWWEDRFASMQPVLVTAALVTLVFVWSSRLAGSRRRALALALGAGFCTMLWPYAYIGMEPVQSLFLLLAGYLALEAPPEPSGKRTVAFSLCAAVAVATKSGGAALVPAVLFLAYVMLRRRPLRLAAALVPVVALFLVNNHFRSLSWQRFGGFGDWSKSIRTDDLVSSAMGAVALLTSPSKGLLVYAPLAIVGLALIHRAYRSRGDRDVAVFALLSLAGPLLLVTQFRIWADETWGPRYLHVAVAPLLLCLASALRGQRPSGFLRALVGGSAAAGLAVSFLGSMFHYGQLAAIATRAAPTSLQAYQGDPTWNHVAFNARLTKAWWRSRSPADSRPELLTPPDVWVSPDRTPIWSSVDLRRVAVPQPVLLRPLAADDPLRGFRPVGATLLVFGALLILSTAAAAAASDEAAEKALEAARTPPVPAPAEPPPPSPSPQTPAELYDGLVGRLGFDTESPGWSPALRDLHRHSRSQRLQLIPDFFYTPVFAPADLPPAVWEGTFPACGDFDLDRQRAFLRETPAFPETLRALPFQPDPDESVYNWGNDQFSHADAALYHALIRRFRPKRIVEVGSGHSTKLARLALGENASGSILCIDPHPPAWLRGLKGPIEIRQEPVQAVADSVFLSLEPSDILFIDGSHICKTGSDVNHLFLRILPRLPAGVVVHIHDICLPFEYPRNWSEDVLCYWNEQYVLAALLANSARFEILVGVYFVQRRDYTALRPFVPEIPGVFPGGGSFWMRVRP